MTAGGTANAGRNRALVSTRNLVRIAITNIENQVVFTTHVTGFGKAKSRFFKSARLTRDRESPSHLIRSFPAFPSLPNHSYLTLTAYFENIVRHAGTGGIICSHCLHPRPVSLQNDRHRLQGFFQLGRYVRNVLKPVLLWQRAS